MIETLPKGGLKDIPDDRDLWASFVGGALPPVNWSAGSGLPRPPVSDQGTSDACGGHAGSKLHWLLKRLLFSARDLFAPVALAYGAYARDIMMRMVNAGQATQLEVPDPPKQNPQSMRDMTGITAAKSASDREANAFTVPTDIESVASAIKAYNGVFLLIEGTNTGWRDLMNPRPPGSEHDSIWGHFLCAYDFHIHNGHRCIITGTSWGGAGVTEHHLSVNYFESGSVPNAWVLIPKERIPMYRRYFVYDEATGRQGVQVINDTGFGDPVVWAKNKAMLQQLAADFEVPANAPTVTFPRINPS